MFKQTVTYENFNGEEVTEDLYFHLNKLEMTRLNFKYDNNIEKYAQNASKDEDGTKMLNFMTDLMLTSFGKKAADGGKFDKSPEIKKDFEYGAAFAELFSMILDDPSLAERFASNLMKVKPDNVTELIVNRENEGGQE